MTSITMRELTQQETAFISGGNANSNYEGGRNTGSTSHKSSNSNGAAPNTCANQVGENAIIGAMLGIPGGPWGVASGAIGFGLSTAVTCSNNGGKNNSGALGGNSNANSVNGQCHW